MPPWLEHALSGLSPEGSAGSFLGTVATLIALVIAKLQAERRKRERLMTSIPPTVCPVPERLPEDAAIATARRICDLEQQVHDLRARLAKVDADRADLASDLSRTASAFSASQRREDSLKEEVEQLREDIKSGRTGRTVRPRARPPASWPPVVAEVDDRPIADKPTPTQGRARVRR